MLIANDIKLLKPRIVETGDNSTTFEFEPLSPGYGITLGHALRRVLLSSLKGSAISAVKIDGVTHEFSTIKGVKEDVTDIILNLKHLTVKSYSEEPVIIKLSKKGPGKVYAKDFTKNAQVDILDQDSLIATLEKDGKLNLEITVEQGYGYVPVEKREGSKLPLGTITVDAIFNPIRKINYTVDNTRVGSVTDYNKLTFDVTTNGTISPKEAMSHATKMLISYLQAMLIEEKAPVKVKKSVAKTKTAKTKPVKKTK